MGFVTLSRLIEDIKQYPTPTGEDMVQNAAIIMIQHYPNTQLEMLNIITMSLLMDRLVVHELSPGASNVVMGTEIRDLPESPPALLRLPWLVETKNMENPLFGDTVCLGGYSVREKYFLIGLRYPDGIRVEPWEPEWGKDLHIPLSQSPFVEKEDKGKHQDWTAQAARFSLGLGLLLEATKTPLAVKGGGKRKSGRRSSKKTNEQDWTTRKVILGKMATRYYNQSSSSSGGESNKEGKVLSRTVVSGHLRYQPYGPGREKRKWIWIDTYEARRWTSAKGKIEVNRG